MGLFFMGVICMGGFRIRSKRFFLTYPQLPGGVDYYEIALCHYEDVFQLTREQFSYVIAKELHKDGNAHIHVYLEFDLKQDIYSAGKLDLKIDGRNFHGNYASARSTHNSIRYILKRINVEERAGNYKTNMVLPFLKGNYYSTVEEHLHAVLLEEGHEAAINVLFTQYPKDCIKRGSALLRNLELLNMYLESNRIGQCGPKYTLSDFKKSSLPKELKDWMKMESPASLILFGETGTGKTELAKALMHEKSVKYLLIRDKEGLKEFRKGFHSGLIFDDIDATKLTREELIHLLDTENESQIRILYGYMTLQEDLIRIFTTNYITRLLRNDKALERRAVKCEIKDNVKKRKRGRPPGSKKK